jgi:hypothetical protein
MAATLTSAQVMALVPCTRYTLAILDAIYAGVGKSAFSALDILGLAGVRAQDKIWAIAQNTAASNNTILYGTNENTAGNKFLPLHAVCRFAADAIENVIGLYDVGDDRISDLVAKIRAYADHRQTPPADLRGLRLSAFSVAVRSLTGHFSPGDLITGGTSGAKGTIVFATNASPIRFVAVSGTFALNETITGPSGTAVVNALPVAESNYAYLSAPIFADGEVITGAQSNASGSISLPGATEFIPYHATFGTFLAGEVITGSSGKKALIGSLWSGLDARFYVFHRATYRLDAWGLNTISPNSNAAMVARAAEFLLRGTSLIIPIQGVSELCAWAAIGAAARMAAAAKVGVSPFLAAQTSAAKEACRTVAAGIAEENYHLTRLTYYVNTFGL